MKTILKTGRPLFASAFDAATAAHEVLLSGTAPRFHAVAGVGLPRGIANPLQSVTGTESRFTLP